jgi:PAP2 superfamily
VADPHGPGRLVNLYAAMPSRHVAWALVRRGRHHRHPQPVAAPGLALPLGHRLGGAASANHFLLDAAGGLAVLGLGLLAPQANSAGHPTVTGEPPPGRTRPAGAHRR